MIEIFLVYKECIAILRLPVSAVRLVGEQLRARFHMCCRKNEKLAERFRVTIPLRVQERMAHFFSFCFERTTRYEKAKFIFSMKRG